MKKIALALAISMWGGLSAQADTLDKVKSSGALTMGVRDSSGALSNT
jgi:glutamate/aspartate transport system substrate-binding protein